MNYDTPGHKGPTKGLQGTVAGIGGKPSFMACRSSRPTVTVITVPRLGATAPTRLDSQRTILPIWAGVAPRAAGR
jgi:hypothetical protein